MKTALLSNVTVDLLAGMLRKTSDVYLSAGFDTWQQDMMLPTSKLYEYNPDSVVVLLHADAYVETWNSIEKGSDVIDAWCSVISFYCSRMPKIPVFVSSIDICNIKAQYGSEIMLNQYFENYFINKIQELHQKGFNVYVLPVKESITDCGRAAFYSSKMWYMGSMPYSMNGLSLLNDLIVRYITVTKGAKKKCIAVDLDNTLWGGVIGEDGVSGIILANNKEGARYKDAQRILKKMKEQGVMLTILSKNNVEDVEPVFSHPDMLLQHDDFVAEVINWEPKPSNIKQLAQNLNIGLDAFVFLDDNPVEREQMKALCPDVEVVDFPKDSSKLPKVVEEIYERYFLTLEVTGEDSKKTAMYRSEVKRKVEMDNSASVEDFLKRLEMTMEIHLMRPEEEKRVTQLTNKTNQFNVTTKRYSEGEIHKFGESDFSDVITVNMADKYGEQGLVSVLILKYEGLSAIIDTFLMSCRVMGRGAETEIMARIGEFLKKKGLKTLKASYIKTAKNAPVIDLFDKLGFTLLESSDNQKNYTAEINMLPKRTEFFKEVSVNL